ncbi:hypothetical protein, partial [Candidatus Ichthyocystis hellenicum]|uniref:hypothetical protein n=1 Tax=Candidatus Ichthyocystis hellenicum TaxID=1561003 RepID=UPI001F5F63DE
MNNINPNRGRQSSGTNNSPNRGSTAQRSQSAGGTSDAADEVRNTHFSVSSDNQRSRTSSSSSVGTSSSSDLDVSVGSDEPRNRTSTVGGPTSRAAAHSSSFGDRAKNRLGKVKDSMSSGAAKIRSQIMGGMSRSKSVSAPDISSKSGTHRDVVQRSHSEPNISSRTGDSASKKKSKLGVLRSKLSKLSGSVELKFPKLGGGKKKSASEPDLRAGSSKSEPVYEEFNELFGNNSAYESAASSLNGDVYYDARDEFDSDSIYYEFDSDSIYESATSMYEPDDYSSRSGLSDNIYDEVYDPSSTYDTLPGQVESAHIYESIVDLEPIYQNYIPEKEVPVPEEYPNSRLSPPLPRRNLVGSQAEWDASRALQERRSRK